MLVISRKTSEAFWINDNIKILIVESRQGHVKIGIEAPQDCVILREELIGTAKPVKRAKETKDP